MLSSTDSTIPNINSESSNLVAIIRSFLSEIYDVEHYVGNLIQQPVYGIASSSRREFNSSTIHWIHGNLCKEIFYAYSAGKQKLSRRLHSALELSIPHHERHSFLLSLTPVLAVLTQKMRHGQAFVETCRVVKRSDEMDLELEWLSRALLFGFSSQAVETHLHDFLICFCSVVDAIKAAEENFATTQRISIVAKPAHTLASRRSSTPLVILLEDFWKDAKTQSSCVLMEGKLLDEARDADLTEMQAKTEQILQRLHQNVSNISNLGYKFCIANNLKWRLQDENLSQIGEKEETRKYGRLWKSIDSDEAIIYGDFTDLEFIDRIVCSSADEEISHISKVQWLPYRSHVFAFKEYSTKDHFLKQTSANLRLNHPNIVQTICAFKQELDSDTSRYGVLMELMDLDLMQFLDSNPRLSLAEKVSIMLQVATAMEYAQSQKNVLCSVRPESIFVKLGQADNGVASFQIKVSGFHSATESKPHDRGVNDVFCFAKICRKILRRSSKLQNRSSFKVLNHDLPSDCPPYLKLCIDTWLNTANRSSSNSIKAEQFTEICRTLRHLYAVLVRENSGNTISSSEQSLLRFNDYEAFMAAREATQKIIQRAMEDMNYGNFNLCRFSKVHTIPYEIHVLSVVLQWAMDLQHRFRSNSLEKFIRFLTSPSPAVMGTAGVFH